MLSPEGLRFMVDCFTPGLTEEERRGIIKRAVRKSNEEQKRMLEGLGDGFNTNQLTL